MTSLPREKKAQMTKEKILQAGITLLGIDGQKGLSASKVASKAGVSKSTIFHHFESMDELLFSIMIYFFQSFTVELSKTPAKTPEKFLQNIGNKALEESIQSRELMLAFLSLYEKALFDERYKALFKEQFENFFQFISKSLQCYYNLKIPKKENHLISMMVTLVCDSMGIYYQIFNDPKKFKEYWTLFSKMVTAYLEKYERKA